MAAEFQQELCITELISSTTLCLPVLTPNEECFALGLRKKVEETERAKLMVRYPVSLQLVKGSAVGREEPGLLNPCTANIVARLKSFVSLSSH